MSKKGEKEEEEEQEDACRGTGASASVGVSGGRWSMRVRCPSRSRPWRLSHVHGVSIAVRFLCAASYKARANGIAQQPIFNSGGK